MSKIELSQSEITRILGAIPDTYYRTNKLGGILFVSDSVTEILGYKPSEVIGRRITEFYVDPCDRERLIEMLQENDGRVAGFECKMLNRNSEEIWVSTSAWFYKDKNGQIKGVEGLIREITSNKQLEDMLRKTSDSFRNLFKEHLNILDYSPGGILKIDRDLTITYMNPAMDEILGVPENEKSSVLLENIMDVKSVQTAGFTPVIEKVQELEEVSMEGPFTSIYGKQTYISVKGVPFIKDGIFEGAVFLITDITKIKEMSDSLRFQASHDSLTGLINRREFEYKLQDAIDSAISENTTHVLCYVDLDQFKVVNDTCGHLAGDNLLRQLCPVLNEVSGKENLLARLGGDEFGVIYYRMSVEDALKKVESLLTAVRNFRFQNEDKIFEIGASIGLAPIHPHNNSISELLAAADSACYLAKEQGRNRIQVYTDHDDALQLQKHHMEWFQILNRAIDQEKFLVYFQPINMASNNVNFEIAGEFLVRMIGEDDRIINPMEFIPTAERYQLMNKIDRYVIDAVFSLLALRPSKQIENKDRVFTINLSGQSVSTPGFFEYVKEKFGEYKILPGSICFEITETAVITNIVSALEFINKLRDLGCLFALDDFGSGMSSLTHLKKIPVDFIKIDGSFITSMHQNPADLVMIKSVVDISRVMNLKTIAENVEDKLTADALRTMGVDYTQGFFHGIPEDAKKHEKI